jgi:hypothetical protein
MEGNDIWFFMSALWFAWENMGCIFLFEMHFNVLVGLPIQVLIVLLAIAFLFVYVKSHVYVACKIVIAVFLRVM